MNLVALKKSSLVTPIIILLLLSTAFGFAIPIVVWAQTAPSGTAASGNPAAGTPAPGASQSPPITCNWYNWMWQWTCLGKSLAVYSSLLFIYLAGKILDIAGVLLNATLDFTVGSGQGTGFDAQIYSRIKNGVEAVWTAFRDIANIIIIGMFTFTALTMILGIQSFNAKRMVAKVLLIAVLINFSLLFTRLIIESSNFVASQFYKAAQFGTQPASTASALTSFGQYQTGISGKFAQLLGVASFADAKNGLWDVAEKQDNGFLAAGMGILTVVIMGAVALVFLYASFLLVARALLFIILLISSSLAFASFLVPSTLTMGTDGWSMWWSSLLKNAVFGPILLIMLWATIILGEGIKGIRGTDTLGGLLTDPAKGGSINALFGYLLILGMLYASIKIASSFSHKIGGMPMTIRGLAAPLAMGIGYGYAPFARRFFGGAAYKEKVRLEEEMETARLGKGKYAGLKGAARIETLASLGKQLGKADARSKSDMNPMNTWLGRKAAGAAGLDGIIAGQTKTSGYAQQVDKSAKALADKFGAATLTKEDQQKMLKEAISAVDDHADAKKLASDAGSAKAVADAAKAWHEPGLVAAQADLEKTRKHYESELSAVRDTIKDAATKLEKAPGSTTHRDELAASEAKERILMHERDTKIGGAQEKVNAFLKTIEGLNEPVKAAQKAYEDRIGELKTEAAKNVEAEIKDYSGALKTAMNRETWSPDVAAKAWKNMENKKEQKKLREIFERYAEDTKGDEGDKTK